jgi:Ca2+-binding RTX toxin-like protein
MATIVGDSLDNILRGTLEPDNISGDAGRDTLFGLAGNDNLDGGNDSDRLEGGNGNDTLFGGSESGPETTDTLIGGRGNDSLRVSDFTNSLMRGDEGNDTLIGAFYAQNIARGGAGSDSLTGGMFDDTLMGGNGNDYNSPPDKDTLVGGAGSDTYVLGNTSSVFYLGEGYATIRSWNASDRIEIHDDISKYAFNKTKNIVGTSAKDTQIFYNNDLIAILQDATNISVGVNIIVV